MTITATEFKAKCLQLMNKVQKTHQSILITKRGQVVAQLSPPPATVKKPWLALRGTAKIIGDIVSPVFSDAEIDRFIEREMKHGKKEKHGRRASH
jgi:prevent-host-death family protein